MRVTHGHLSLSPPGEGQPNTAHLAVSRTGGLEQVGIFLKPRNPGPAFP